MARSRQVAWIERKDGDQQFHVVFKAGNAKRTFRCENLTSRANAIKALTALGETFSPAGLSRVTPAPLLASGLALRVYYGTADFEYIEVEIVERDLRTPKA